MVKKRRRRRRRNQPVEERKLCCQLEHVQCVLDDAAKHGGQTFVGNNERQQHPGGIREEGKMAQHRAVCGKKVLFESGGIWGA